MKQLNFFVESRASHDVASQLTPASERWRLEHKYAPLIKEELQLANIVSYVPNKKLPLLRLYRYKEAFASRFVEEFINRFGLTERDYLFDPFCGMGTTLFVAAQKGIASVGIDRLPVGVFIARTLPLFYSIQSGQLRKTFERLKDKVHQAAPADAALDVAIMKVAFPPDVLVTLRKWKTLVSHLETPLREIFQLLLLSILEECSYTSKDGQFLRLLKDKQVAEPTDALERKVHDAETDIRLLNELHWQPPKPLPSICLGDTRDLSEINFERKPTAIITSPPYANRYDYTRSYSLELCFQFVSDFEELKNLRFSVLRSHIESKVEAHEEASHSAVTEVVHPLRAKRRELNNPKIPDMITGYFVDMEKAIKEWSKVLAPKAKVALVVDNVRFVGELLPVDLILSEMAEEAGFAVEEIIVARYKGNSSQQMGKYGRVPVRESIVIWRKL
jgi:hypothetical protein